MARCRAVQPLTFLPPGLLLAGAAFLGPLAAPKGPLRSTAPRTNAQVAAAYARLPLAFEENRGQTDGQVEFLSRTPDGTLFLTGTEAVLALPGARKQGAPNSSRAVRMRLAGSRSRPKTRGLEPLPCRANYFYGNDPKKWRTGVAQYSRVKYDAVYPGVDLIYYGNGGRLEFDFIVEPGADPAQIRIAYEGADSLKLDAEGDLLLEVGGATVRQHRPEVYQEIEGHRRPVPASYVLASADIPDAGRVSFDLGDYDRSKPLVIDPVLAYSSYLGGGWNNTIGTSGYDCGYGIAVDSAGYAFVTGTTLSPIFPLRDALQGDQTQWDVFVTKLNLNPTAGSPPLLYSTYLGGFYQESGLGIATDGAGGAYVTGNTASGNFPLKNPYQSVRKGNYDAFVTKLDTTLDGLASLRYSTLLGGNADDSGYGIAVDASTGYAYIAGAGAPPTKNGFQGSYGGGWSDGFMAKLDPNAVGAASLLYSTQIGGSGVDYAYAIATDGTGRAYVAGATESVNFPSTPGPFQSFRGCWDAFVVCVDSIATDAASRVYADYIGGGFYDMAYGIAADAAGNAYVTGVSNSLNFPTVNAYQSGQLNYNAFVTKLDPTGLSILYSTHLGGSGQDTGRAIGVDPQGNIYVAGLTYSSDFPTHDAIQLDQGNVDGFVARLDPFENGAASLVYSTYLGGSLADAAFGLAVHESGSAYVTGMTSSIDFPTTSNPFQGDQAAEDAFVSKIAPPPPPASLALGSGIYQVPETAGSAAVLVTRAGDLSSSASVNYATSDVTALAGSDYSAVSGVLSFSPGQASAVVNVPLMGDAALEGDEAFAFTLSGPVGGTLVAPTSASVIIGDDIDTPAPSTVRFVVASPTAINVSWVDHCTNEGPTAGFEVSYSTAGTAGPWMGTVTRGPSSPPSQTGATLSKQVNLGLVPGSTYYFQVVAVRGAAASAPAVEGPVFLGAPDAPTSLSVVAVTCTTVKLQWTDQANNETGFDVQRSPTGLPGSYTSVATHGAVPGTGGVVTETDGTATPLSPGTTYYYRVVAVNLAVPGESPAATVSATTTAAPSAPINLTASPVSSTSIKLTWQDTATTEQGFHVESSTTGLPGSFVYLPPAVGLSPGSGGLKSRTVTGLTTGTQYWFRVRAYNGAYFTGYTNDATATP
jgi:hypothetical protein